MRNKQKIIVDQLDRKLLAFQSAFDSIVPEKGWIYTIRTALKMTLEQLGNKLEITKQGVKKIEESEAAESISLKSLKEAGNALGMKLVYGFVPYEGSLENHLDKKARELAVKIVMRTSNNMKLEDQKIANDRIQKAIEELTVEIRNEMPRALWD